jgi:transcriptional antiterminator RfaH
MKPLVREPRQFLMNGPLSFVRANLQLYNSSLDQWGDYLKMEIMNEASSTWFVAHTRPRREKKLVGYCEREGISATLPCYRVIHNYKGKTVSFEKPLFPGYVFLKILRDQKQRVVQSDHVASLLFVPDQDLLAEQLNNILRVLNTELEVRLMPEIHPGSRVKIRFGPLEGMEGWVTERTGLTSVLLRVDFIGQAAAVKIEADQLELL